jgi:hypothetical protein
MRAAEAAQVPVITPTAVRRNWPFAKKAQQGGSFRRAAWRTSPSAAMVSGGTRLPDRLMIWLATSRDYRPFFGDQP